MFQEKVAALCTRAGLPRPLPEKDGSLSLHLADGLSISLSPRGADILVRGKVRALPAGEGERDELCRRLLVLSLGRAGKECRSALPGLAVEEDEIILALFIPADCSHNDFDAGMEAYLNYLETWRKLAESSAARPPAAFSSLVGGIRP